MRTLKQLEGITYWVIDDPDEIRGFINRNVRREWERDNLDDDMDSRTDEWLLSLSLRSWRLRRLRINDITLQSTMTNDRAFVIRLSRRTDELTRSITDYGVVIWPVVVRAEDQILKDGYCRLTSLRRLGVRRVLAYTGSLREARKKGDLSNEDIYRNRRPTR